MLKRNKEYIQKNLYEKNNKIYTKVKTIVEIPKIFEDKNMLVIDKKVSYYGVCAIIMDDYYSVSCIPTLITCNPLTITEVEKEDSSYIQLIFAEDSEFIDNKSIIRHKLLSYNLFDLFFSQGKLPWYVEYEDVLKILDNLPLYAESNLGDNFISNEILTSFITRLKENPAVFLRQTNITDREKYTYVDLEDPYYSMNSTVNKIGGSYFNEGLVSALVEKEKSPTKLENLVRR